MALVAKAHFGCNLGQAQLACAKQSLRALDPALQQMLMRTGPNGVAESGAKLAHPHVSLSGQFIESEWPVQFRFDELQYALQTRG